MDLVLDGNGPVYNQLARALRKAMANGRLPMGTRLPASRVLARQLGLSRATVVKVYEQLRIDGYLTGQVGSGTYVAQPRISNRTQVRSHRLVAAQSAYAGRLRCVEGGTSPFGARSREIRYAFRYSQPTVDPTLAARWVRELEKTAPYVKLGYPPPQGLQTLREAIARHIGKTRGVVCDADDIVVTAGVQQALSLICDVLVDPGDAVVLEEPHYFNARVVFQMKGAAIVPVKVDAQGLITSELPRLPPPKLVYVTPSHQCPTGAVLSQERRHDLLHYAQTHGTWICEDDYDGEFRHETRAVESLQSMDRSSQVIYVGSFSKTLFPSLRMGYLVAPAGLRDDFVKAKWASDFGSSPFEQSALASFIAEGGYDRHLLLATKKLAERRAVLREALHSHCGNRVEIIEAGSGMHLLVWVRGADRADGQAITRKASQRGVALYPVEHFYMDPPDRAGFVMGFSTMAPADIRDAVALFAECIGLPRHASERRRYVKGRLP